MGRRSGRAAARRAAAAIGTTPARRTRNHREPESPVEAPSPQAEDVAEDDDEPMHDAGVSDSEQPVEADVEDEEGAGAESGDEEAEKEVTPEAEAEEEGKEPTPPPEPVIRKKRLGRPPKNRPPDWDLQPATPGDSDSTPRRRGRGGWRGRGGRKGAPAPTKQQQAIDKEGTVVDIVNDECVLPDIEEGETKVDKLGNLLGGREYRCRTFTVLGRGDRLYMLSTEPARCVGFRDSYLFFTKHLRLYKIIVDDEEKRDMIERDIIPHSYKGRAIGIVTARSVFREFGARIVVGGKWITDDYNADLSRAEGAVEGEIADPTDHFIEGEPYNKNQYVAWHGASAVYHQIVPAVQAPIGKQEVKKRRVNVNDVNWKYEHAFEASAFNAQLGAARRANLNGVYDIHTNLNLYPAIMQPTHAHIEQLPPRDDAGSTVNGDLLPRRIHRNFLVTDTFFEAPTTGISPMAYESSDPSDPLASFRGLSAVPKGIRELLPPECREAFDLAVRSEAQWKEKWKPESEAACRRPPLVEKHPLPYNVI